MIFSREDIAALGAAIRSEEPLRDAWQPVHTLYGGAHLFRRDAVEKLGAIARRTFEAQAPDGASLARIFAWESSIDPDRVHARLARRLAERPVEDLRIDFEDGYGERPHDEEDGDARRAGEEVAAAIEAKTAPRRMGIRCKAFTRASFERAVRTLDLFFSELAPRAVLPREFVVTLPKVRSDEDVILFGRVLREIEKGWRWPEASIGAELMLETPAAVLDASGSSPLTRWRELLGGRLVGVHLGSYDLTASLDVGAADQTPDHPACAAARVLAKLAFAGTGVDVSDGATAVLPVARHRSPANDAEARENQDVIERALRLHAGNVRAALRVGIHQGWDLHPAQLVARHAAMIVFYMDSLPAATARLASFVANEERASRVGEAFDDAATGAGLRSLFRRGLACGALDAAEARAAGVTDEEIATWGEAAPGPRS